MKAKTEVFGKIVKKYSMPSDAIEDLNNKYESEKRRLNSFGHRLAGRLDSELEFTNLLGQTKISKNIVDCMNDYMDTLLQVGLIEDNQQLTILSCWINDMRENEYNPPHTHHNGTGWSTVLFLKIPEFVNDARDPHKFKDGQLAFLGDNGRITWHEPKVGDFYIFEAIHTHCVMPFKTKNKNDIRRSMSFNFIKKL